MEENLLRRSGKVLHKVAELMRQRKDEFAELITLEMGKLGSSGMGSQSKC
jgi:acyl-CoA reductase-like NAD-dependent aldehyde dehydrogenase